MNMRISIRVLFAKVNAVVFATLTAACSSSDQATPASSATDSAVVDTASPPSQLRFEVDIASRLVRVIDGADTVAVHPVAVGSAEWPTRTGEWTIGQVVLNPEWIPPDESWAEEREGRQPGDPANPLGRAQLVYDLPRSIHGTNNPESIGKAVSHGSIRVTNEVALSLAQLLIVRTSAGDANQLLNAAQRDSSQKFVIDLPYRVPVRVF